MKNAKSRPKARLDKNMYIYSNNTWQGLEVGNQTSSGMGPSSDIDEIRALLAEESKEGQRLDRWYTDRHASS